jgi:hypothetical protein
MYLFAIPIDLPKRALRRRSVALEARTIMRYWFNNQRLFEPIGNIPPAEFEKEYYTDVHSQPVVAGLT